MSAPPPLPHASPNRNARGWRIILGIVCSVVVLVAVGAFATVHYLGASGITRLFDNKFGDQNLKSTVALLELHKIRYGRYPKSLRELRFKGDWDEIWLNATRYVVSPDGTKYCVEVERGWIGKPVLNYPPEFWRNTGYSPDLCSHSQ